jgi:hypothetical protein
MWDHKKPGKATYKAAKGPVGKASYSGHGQKKAKNSRLAVDKKVKRISNKVMKGHTKPSGPAAFSQSYKGNIA